MYVSIPKEGQHMTEMATAPAAVPVVPGSDPAIAPAATVVPDGYVLQAEVEKAREESRRRYQGEADVLKAELARLKATATPAPTAKEEDGGGFDPAAFQRQLLSQVYGATALSTAVAEVRAAFPHADPGIFAPDQLSQFSNPEALRFAAEDSHNRVAAILQAEKVKWETVGREEIANAGGPSPVTPAGHIPAGGGDPTPAQMAAMSIPQLNALEAANPGVTDRVLAKAAVGA
jgi:hypothetical protein